MARATLPSALDPILDGSGAMANSWRRFFEGLFTINGSGKDIALTPTSNTTLDVSYRGTDGVVRKTTLTLS